MVVVCRRRCHQEMLPAAHLTPSVRPHIKVTVTYLKSEGDYAILQSQPT